MTEEQAREAQAQAREFPEALKIIDRIRAALAERVFQTAISAQQEREDLYTRVQALDALKSEMESLLANSASEKAITEYIESLATSGK